jgi:hypothetical protein
MRSRDSASSAVENGQNGVRAFAARDEGRARTSAPLSLPFVDLLPPDRESPIDYELFTEVPVD